MNRLFVSFVLFALTLISSSCRERQASTGNASDRAKIEAFQALAKNKEEIRRRINDAEILVPGTETTVHLTDGRGSGPGAPPVWNVELRNVAGAVPTAQGLDVFADLAIHRALKAPDCYLVLFRLDEAKTAFSSAISIGEGARVVEAKPRNTKGDRYDLEFEYLERAPQGDFLSNPSVRKRRTVSVADHAFVAAPPTPVASRP